MCVSKLASRCMLPFFHGPPSLRFSLLKARCTTLPWFVGHRHPSFSPQMCQSRGLFNLLNCLNLEEISREEGKSACFTVPHNLSFRPQAGLVILEPR